MSFNFKIATKVVVSYSDSDDKKFELLIGGVTYEYGVGF